MNQFIKKLNVEKVLFFDIEVVRNQESLDIDSKEFEMFQRKTRNRDTDKFLSDQEVVELYNRQAGLKMCYNKVVCISCGAIRDGELYVKSYIGSEEEIINSFYKKCSEFDYVAGYNILYYDLPMVQANSMRYTLKNNVPERFNVSGKKPWNMGDIIELMDVFKGTHFYNPSLDEVCFHLGVKSSKEGGIDGSKVSDVYYEGGIEEIRKYCNRDILATVNVFNSLVGTDTFDDFIDLTESVEEDPKETVYEVIQREGSISVEVGDYFIDQAKSLNAKEKKNLMKLILAALGKKESDLDKDEKELFEKLK